MANTDCISDLCPGEASLEQQIEGSGYTDGADRYAFGTAVGCGSTPKLTVARWMAQRGTRKILTRRSFTDFGVGVHKEVGPPCGGSRVPFSVVMGMRKR